MIKNLLLSRYYLNFLTLNKIDIFYKEDYNVQ